MLQMRFADQVKRPRSPDYASTEREISMAKFMIRLSWLLAVLVGGLAVPGTALAAPAPAPQYCDQFIETGAEVCFPTAQKLQSYEAAAALDPLVTMFDDINWNAALGYRNFVSAYGRDYCTAPLSPNEASSGDLRTLDWSKGGPLASDISSYAILPGSLCQVTFYDRIGFQGQSQASMSSCADMRTCFPANWNNRALSFTVS
jgi:hypothetical protein